MTTTTIAGGHGQIALLLTRILADRGEEVRNLIRDPAQSADIESAGGTPVVIDLEQTDVDGLAEAVRGSDAVVFAAGAGPGSGIPRKESVDFAAAVLLRDAAVAAEVDRYVMVSAMGTDDPPEGDDVFEVYLRAKARADEAVMSSDLRWTIVRPGGLTDDPATGRVALARHVDRGSIPRADVASVLDVVLHEESAVGHVVEVVSGDAPIAEAVAALS